MAQNRKPPAYQEYAASILANRDFRRMSLTARGLAWTLRLEFWENGDLPSDPAELAEFLGKQVSPDLLGQVMPLFEVTENGISSAELYDYKLHLTEAREKQAAGGRKGAKIKKLKNDSKVESQVDLKEDLKVSSLDKPSLDKLRSEKLIRKGSNREQKDFGTDIDLTEPPF